MGTLDGTVAIVSGAARGQGRSHAVRLAADGARVVGFDLCKQIEGVPYPMSTPDDLAETERLVRDAGGEMITMVGDVRVQIDLDAVVAKAVEEFGRVDIVLANAGIAQPHGKSWDLDEEMFLQTIDVDLVGVWRTIKAAVPRMIEQGDGGAIVVTGSGASICGLPNVSAYTAAKHGLIGLVRSIAKELGPHRIRINAVLPANTNTMMFNNANTRGLFVPGTSEPTQEQFLARAARMSPMGVPMVEPEDISDTVAWLVSPAAKYVTGTAVPVDGGSAIP